MAQPHLAVRLYIQARPIADDIEGVDQGGRTASKRDDPPAHCLDKCNVGASFLRRHRREARAEKRYENHRRFDHLAHGQPLHPFERNCNGKELGMDG